jgi:L-fuconolactonase
MTEAIIDPDLPIIDPHHHLWDMELLLPSIAEDKHGFADMLRMYTCYMFEDLLADTRTGHNVIGTVYVQCTAFHRADGPEEMKPVGEVEFVNGVAARSASGIYGNIRACAGIVGHAHMALGDKVAAVLEAEVAAGNGRLRGIRDMAAHNADPAVLGPLATIVTTPPHQLANPEFRAGFAHLDRYGLSFDAWVLEPQIDEVTDLADAFPNTPIVLDHAGTPLGLGSFRGKLPERFGVWRDAIKRLAERPNVMVKLGGLAMPFCGFDHIGPNERSDSKLLAEMWGPYIETCIDAFGTKRAMFESNFPVDKWGVDYATLWNAFKRIAGGASAEEKSDLFAGNAQRFYRLSL